MDIKIGKPTDIDTTLRQYSRGNRDIELLDMWTPNPDTPRRARRPRDRREVRVDAL